MPRLGVVSDTHGYNLLYLAEVLKGSRLDSLIFLGDNHPDGLLLGDLSGLDLVAVLGNNEPWLGGQVPWELVEELAGYRVFACHGHRYGIKSGLDRLSYRAEELGADICLFGHSHIFEDLTINGVRYLNPGSPSLPRSKDRAKTFGILELGQEVKFDQVKL